MSEYEIPNEVVDSILDTDAQRKKRKLNAEQEALLIADVKHVISSASGRRFIWWLICQGNIFADTYNGKALDMAYCEGLKSSAISTLTYAVKADKMFLPKLFQELLARKGEL